MLSVYLRARSDSVFAWSHSIFDATNSPTCWRNSTNSLMSWLFVLRLSSICPNLFHFVFFLLPLLLWCLLAFFLFFSFAFISFSFVAHLISFSFQKTFYPIITHSSSFGPKTPYVRCMVLANKVFSRLWFSQGWLKLRFPAEYDRGETSKATVPRRMLGLRYFFGLDHIVFPGCVWSKRIVSDQFPNVCLYCH